MAKRSPLTDKNGEVRELTKEDLKRFKSASDVLPAETLIVLQRRGRPRAKNTKQTVCIRLAPDILDAFKATGSGWQTRINEALKDWLREHRPS